MRRVHRMGLSNLLHGTLVGCILLPDYQTLLRRFAASFDTYQIGPDAPSLGPAEVGIK